MWVPKITNTNPKQLVLCLRKDEQIKSNLKRKGEENFYPKIENSKSSLSLQISAKSLSLRVMDEFYVYEKW